MSSNLEKFIYSIGSSIKQINVTPMFRYLIDCHSEASKRRDHNCFFFTSFIIRFLLLAKQLEDLNKTARKQTAERYDRFLQFMLFSNANNINVDFTSFMQRIRYGLKFCFRIDDINQVETVIQQLHYIEDNNSMVMNNNIIYTNSNTVMQQIIELKECNNSLVSQLNNRNSLTDGTHTTLPSSAHESNKRSKTSTSGGINGVKTFLYDAPAALLQIFGENPDSHLTMSYIILLFIKSGIDICPTNIKETNSFYSCVELNYNINELRISFKGFLQANDAFSVNAKIGFPNMYETQALSDILNRVLNDSPENAKNDELQLAILCFSYTHNINVILIEYESGKLSTICSYKGYDRLHLNFKDSKIPVDAIVTYTKDNQKVYQMFKQMVTDYDPFDSYNIDHLVNI
jgi:hypothetical protein